MQYFVTIFAHDEADSSAVSFKTTAVILQFDGGRFVQSSAGFYNLTAVILSKVAQLSD